MSCAVNLIVQAQSYRLFKKRCLDSIALDSLYKHVKHNFEISCISEKKQCVIRRRLGTPNCNQTFLG